ncbi:MAG TPA: hypothetical protein VFG22_06230, partial [Polyangiales bacterium]|nr:hypothetical protein [Polyangiales bacterium]
MKSRLVLAVALCLLGFTCDETGAGPEAASKPGAGQPSQESADKSPTEGPGAATPAPAVAPAPNGTAPYEDLLALLHLADIYDPAGLFIEFGTSARLKYTLGNWNSGWQAESREGGATVSTFAKSARLYLPAATVQPMRLRIRARVYATGALIVYVNGETAGEARVTQGGGFQDIVIPISGAHIREGENAIMLRATQTAQVRGEARSLALDWLRFEPASSTD